MAQVKSTYSELKIAEMENTIDFLLAYHREYAPRKTSDWSPKIVTLIGELVVLKNETIKRSEEN